MFNTNPRDINSKCRSYPDDWYYDVENESQENLTRFQYICLEICGKMKKGELDESAKAEYYKIIDDLVQQGSRLDALHHSFGGFANTPLLEALSCETQNDEWLADVIIDMAVKYQQHMVLIQRNGGTGSVEEEPSRFSSPLIFALKCGRSSRLVIKLIESIPEGYRNESINMEDSFGFTALDYVCYCGHDDIIECLIDNDANIDREIQGKTPYDFYCYKYPSTRGDLSKLRHRAIIKHDCNVIESMALNGGCFFTKTFNLANLGKEVDEEIGSRLQPSFVRTLQ